MHLPGEWRHYICDAWRVIYKCRFRKYVLFGRNVWHTCRPVWKIYLFSLCQWLGLKQRHDNRPTTLLYSLWRIWIDILLCIRKQNATDSYLSCLRWFICFGVDSVSVHAQAQGILWNSYLYTASDFSLHTLWWGSGSKFGRYLLCQIQTQTQIQIRQCEVTLRKARSGQLFHVIYMYYMVETFHWYGQFTFFQTHDTHHALFASASYDVSPPKSLWCHTWYYWLLEWAIP